jgi:hypothetical protein
MTPAEAAAGFIARAQAVLTRARHSEFPWPDEGRKDIGNAVWFLADSLKCHREMRCGIIAPDSEFEGMAGPDALGEALAKVAADVAKDAEALAEVIRKHCGDEAAAFVADGPELRTNDSGGSTP